MDLDNSSKAQRCSILTLKAMKEFSYPVGIKYMKV